MRRTVSWAARAASFLSAVLCTGCLQGRAVEHGIDPPPPRARVEAEEDPDTGEIREGAVLAYADGRVVKHGHEVDRYANGTLRAERHFQHGEPTGLWRSWYADGTLRSEYEYAGPETVTTMRFYYESAELRAEGPARHGSREGEWTFYHAGGAIEKRGTYRAGRRDGVWTYWYPSGELRERGSFKTDARVLGTWERWEDRPLRGHQAEDQ